MDWDPEVRAKLKKLKRQRELRERELRALKEESSFREQQKTAALRPISQAAPDIKMVVGDWYTDELGNYARLIYNAKTVAFELPYDSLPSLQSASQSLT
jgi:hypothetical protein